MTRSDRKLFVMVVEDEEAIATIMIRYLEVSGYRAKAVTSVRGALHMATEEKPDIVVTDIFLGDGDGFGLIEALRTADPDLPIIAISGGRSGFNVLAHAAKLGANATIEKPFSQAYLVDTIERCLESEDRP